MKKVLLTVVIAVLAFVDSNAQQVEYKVVTSVESLVSSGAGRSRMMVTNSEKNYKDYTSTRSSEKGKDERNKSDRGEIRVKDFDETKLLNFYNVAGIRFQNIVANDAIVTSKINDLSNEGWELAFVVSGVESDAGKGDANGIFITRYIFKRNK